MWKPFVQMKRNFRFYRNTMIHEEEKSLSSSLLQQILLGLRQLSKYGHCFSSHLISPEISQTTTKQTLLLLSLFFGIFCLVNILCRRAKPQLWYQSIIYLLLLLRKPDKNTFCFSDLSKTSHLESIKNIKNTRNPDNKFRNNSSP